MSDKTNTNNQRGIAHRFPADARREGAGTHITRWFVPTDYAITDPFLLFDETSSKNTPAVFLNIRIVVLRP